MLKLMLVVPFLMLGNMPLAADQVAPQAVFSIAGPTARCGADIDAVKKAWVDGAMGDSFLTMIISLPQAVDHAETSVVKLNC